MPKIYETIDDIRRDELVKKVATDKAEASNLFNIAAPYLVIGTLAQMIEIAQKHLIDLPKSKLWDAFGKKDSWTPGVLKWVGYISAIASVITGFYYKHAQRKAEKELAALESKSAIAPKSERDKEMPTSPDKGADSKQRPEPSTIVQYDISSERLKKQPITLTSAI